MAMLSGRFLCTMPVRPPVFRPHALGTRQASAQSYERSRGSARERGYDGRWSKASKTFLLENPLCEYHLLLDGRSVSATLTDHLYPQQVYEGVFWTRKWWVGSCDACHSGFKQSVERQGKAAIDDLARRLGREVLKMQ